MKQLLTSLKVVVKQISLSPLVYKAPCRKQNHSQNFLYPLQATCAVGAQFEKISEYGNQKSENGIESIFDRSESGNLKSSENLKKKSEIGSNFK